MGVGVKYNLYICDINYNKLVLVDYIFLQYSEVINAIPQAYFVLQTQSPELKKIQFRPFEKVYTCIIERNGVEKFRGEIDRMATPKNNTPVSLNLAEAYGTMDRVEFNASHFLQRASNLNVTGKEADGTVNNTYTRTFADNTKIGDAIRTLMTEAINIPGSPIADLVLGTIENPLNSSGAEITIGSEQSLYSTNYLYCLSLLAGIGYSDFYFTNTTTLNVVNKRQTDLSNSVKFKLKKDDTSSNLTGITYDIDRQNMANEVTVIGGQTGINLIVKTATDTNNRANFGLRQRGTLARDLDSEETAQLYANNVLRDYSSVVPAYAINIYPLQDHIPFSNFSLGDVVMLDVDFDFTIFTKPMRISGALISVENNGVERVYYSIEEPKV